MPRSNSPRHDEGNCRHVQQMIGRHRHGADISASKRACAAARIEAGEATDRDVHRISDRPAANDGIEAQNEEGGDDPHEADQRPEARCTHLASDIGDRIRGVRPSPPSDGEFHQHQRKHDQSQAEKIEQHERAAAIGADLVGKLPDAAEADRCADCRQDEAGRARPEILGLAHRGL